MSEPELRFPEFTGEWEEKKLGDISSDVMYGMNAAATDFDGENKYIRITDISENSNNYVPKPICSPNKNLEDKFLLKENDLLFARTGASTGKSYLYNTEDGKLYFAGFLIKFHVNKANSKFVFYNTLRSKYENWVRIMSVRSGQPGINAEEYKKLVINLPSIAEQYKIASFLSKVDEKIGFLEKKQELCKTYKKGMMQKIFSQNLRFKDEAEKYYPDWEEKRFEDIMDYGKAGGTPTSTNKDFYDGTIPFLSIADMTSQGKFINFTEKYITEEGLKSSSAWIIPKNSLIYSIYASVGSVAINKSDITTSQAIFGIILKEKIAELDYIYYYLIDYQKYIHRFIETGTQGNLNANTVRNLIIKLPIIEEQLKIASTLSSIDNKIDQLEKELEINYKFKKGLLQQLFC